MDIKEKEKEQFGATFVQVTEKEWIKPKKDKVVIYVLIKRKFQKCILGCLMLFLTILGFSVGILQVRTVSTKELSGLKDDIGKYVAGDISFRTKIVETDFGALNGGDRKWKYFVGIPYGEQGKYVILLVDEKSYEKYKILPEIDLSQKGTYKPEDGKSVRVEGKVKNLAKLPQNFEYWCEIVGITEEMLQDENGSFSPEKQEELLKEKISMFVYIEPKDIFHEKVRKILLEAAGIFVIMGIVLWKKRFSFYETIERV